MTAVKLCGMQSKRDILMANELCPRYVGFVFAPRSRRYVTVHEAEEMKLLLRPRVRTVGVFVDEDPEVIIHLLSRGVIDVVQLHGKEDDQTVLYLKRRTDRTIFQAFRIETEADVRAAGGSHADMVLLDAGAGNGEVFDWSLLDHMDRPYFLAGGLTPENVGSSIRRLHPYGVDVSSGIERYGVKDPGRMTAFMTAVRAEDANMR